MSEKITAKEALATAKTNKAAATATQAQSPAKGRSIKDLIQIMKPEIGKALPSVLTAERFTRMALTAVSTNPTLSECSQNSFLGALMTAAQLGLEPNTPLGQAYIIPYRNKGRLEAQFQIGYKGLLDLAHRSGEFSTIYAHTVYENDEFEYELGLNQTLRHKPANGERGAATHYYAVYHLVNGGYGFEVMTKADAIMHQQRYSKAGSVYSPWATNFDEMAKKTVIKKLLKYAPIKTDFARQITSDESVKTEICDDMSLVASILKADEEAEFEDVLTEDIAREHRAEVPSGNLG
ncbi:recombinase RecT [Bacteroides heparinolyticus]|uniref:recombinase RecT n=1 Tax=Prevotella heparinolytica TaxID=28113 RepID=UPI0035A09BB8